MRSFASEAGSSRSGPSSSLGRAVALVVFAACLGSCLVSCGSGDSLADNVRLTYRMEGEPDVAVLGEVAAVIRERLRRLGGGVVVEHEDGARFSLVIPRSTEEDLKFLKSTVSQFGRLEFAIEATEDEFPDFWDGGLGPTFSVETFHRSIQAEVEARKKSDPKRFDPEMYTGEPIDLYANAENWAEPAKPGDAPRFRYFPPRRWRSSRDGKVYGPGHGAIVHTRADMRFDGHRIEETYPTTHGVEQVVFFRMEPAARKPFEEMTRRNRRRKLCVIFNDELLTRPTIQSPLPGQGIIDGFDEQENLRAIIIAMKSGQLPRRITLEDEKASGSQK